RFAYDKDVVKRIGDDYRNEMKFQLPLPDNRKELVELLDLESAAGFESVLYRYFIRRFSRLARSSAYVIRLYGIVRFIRHLPPPPLLYLRQPRRMMLRYYRAYGFARFRFPVISLARSRRPTFR